MDYKHLVLILHILILKNIKVGDFVESPSLKPLLLKNEKLCLRLCWIFYYSYSFLHPEAYAYPMTFSLQL